ncbi:hypothetical protein BKA24_001686 [Microbacterium marinum]|uniref:Uncharacterized protein n=1 Tax=Microbacterium marinum TaxID=421115 RepID=A0A7W7BQK4_9MICO|nr:hypothetical protein [Microbacterium marinum]MBB4666977.1 hypothetical protein [Microbacterium marinum]
MGRPTKVTAAESGEIEGAEVSATADAAASSAPAVPDAERPAPVSDEPTTAPAPAGDDAADASTDAAPTDADDASTDATPADADDEFDSGIADVDEVEVFVAVTITGTRNGEPWPAVGEPITLPATEAEAYLAAGYVTAD